MSVRVKICGITNLRDAHRALDLGADALGFVFYADSPRAVSPEMARRIIETLPPLVTTVGVFVNEAIDTVRAVRRLTGIALAQLHGDESPEAANALGPSVIKTIRVRGMESFAGIDRYQPRAFLLDTFSEAGYGGTGRRFAWDLAKLVEDVPFFLAGGLTPANVAEAIAATRPYAVDVSSGVEAEPGRKDPVKLKAFIENAKAAP